jgi:dihydroorotate dehydrogenase
LADSYGRYVPLAIKIAPDLADTDLITVGQALLRHGMDAVIATNTTFSRVGVEHLPDSGETGGLSGAPLMARSTEVVRQLAGILGGELPIIAAGGILSGADAAAKIAAGARLVQIYTGLIYRGPALIREAVEALREQSGQKSC